jgi:hypothetical protein
MPYLPPSLAAMESNSVAYAVVAGRTVVPGSDAFAKPPYATERGGRAGKNAVGSLTPFGWHEKACVFASHGRSYPSRPSRRASSTTHATSSQVPARACLAFAPRTSRRDFFQTPDSVPAVFEGALPSGAAGDQKSMPPPMPPPDIAGAAFSGVSATIASVVMRSAAIEAAPCRARRMTLVGSMMPAFTMST